MANPSSRLEKKIEKAQLVLQQLNEIGIDLKSVSQKLEEEGIKKFVKSFEQLLQAIDQQCMEEAES
jgi:transaldolase